jgi:hypothetical protein
MFLAAMAQTGTSIFARIPSMFAHWYREPIFETMGEGKSGRGRARALIGEEKPS